MCGILFTAFLFCFYPRNAAVLSAASSNINYFLILLNKVKGLFENGGIFDFNEKQKKLFHHIAARIFEQNDENQTWNR